MTRRGKIVCTLGPATQRDDLVRALVEAGMDVARMNFSHGDYDDHKVAYERVRVASDATGRAVGVLADLQGPKIRLGRFASGPPTGPKAKPSGSPWRLRGQPRSGVHHLQAASPGRGGR